MKLIIASDIHGAARRCAQLMDAIDQHQPHKVVLLGDLLYHGPRNRLPADYAPKEVIAMLNGISHDVVAVRGNCEAEVDQMVLDFPCMADYAVVLDAQQARSADGQPVQLPEEGTRASAAGRPRELFCTHGHLYGPQNLPNIALGGAVVFGHTHVKLNAPSQDFPAIHLFNPGSLGIPKDGTASYGIYEDGEFRHVLLD